MIRLFKKPGGFLWDEGNANKNLIKHRVSNAEAEEAFFDSQYQLSKDPLHSKGESRFHLVGKDSSNRLLSVTFTVRNNLVRIISARPASRRERTIYEKTTKAT